MKYLGDFAVNKTVRIPFNTTSGAGASVTFTGTTVRIYKDSSTTERSSSNGITLNKDFDGVTGTHLLVIDLSDNTDAGFYASGHDYHAELNGATIDGQTVNAFLGSWSIENRSALRPTTADRTLDVSATGEAGVDWANVGSPTTTVGLTGTTISTSQAVASVSGAVGSVTTVTDKTGYKLASDGLDSVSTTAPSGVASNFREMLVQVWRRFFKRTVNNKSALTIATYRDDGTTVATTQSYTTSGTVDDVGAAT